MYQCINKISFVICQAYTFVEMFCGEGWCSRCMRCAGHPTAQMDLCLSSPERKTSNQNEMDLLTESGFLLLVLKVVYPRISQIMQ